MSERFDFDKYRTEALALSDYPRAGDRKTIQRVRNALQQRDMGYDPDTITDLIVAVLGEASSDNSLPVYPLMAMCGEAGEAAEKVKKAWRDGTPLDRVDLVKELGDVLWYITAAARDIGFTLEDVARINIEKLRSRRDRGTLAGSGDNR